MSPPRLHVIPAIASPKALILRRGPTEMVSSILWDRETNRFYPGQWLRGRLYEHLSDLSPDGRHMVYFAGNGRRWWTALSRAPWLTALYFMPQETKWCGGGAFTETGALWLNGGVVDLHRLPDDLTAARDDAYPHATDGFHMGDLFAQGMCRRGWVFEKGQGYDAVLARQLTSSLSLRLTFEVGADNRSMISNRYALRRGVALQPQPSWEWADKWGGSLQFAMKGALFQAEFVGDKLGPAHRLRDFSGMKFKARKAPYEGVSEPEG